MLCSCSSRQDIDSFDSLTESFLWEQIAGYWDLNYTFPTSYLQSRDTEAWYFEQGKSIDRVLLQHASELVYYDYDTVLLITYHDDTLIYFNLPCSCDRKDYLPYGPRAFDSLNNLILDDFIQVEENGYLDRLTYDLIYKVQPFIDKEMNSIGYCSIPNDLEEYPRYLLIEYLPKNDSIHLIKACKKYSSYFFDEYANVLRNVFLEYCNNNDVARLLTPVGIYILKSD